MVVGSWCMIMYDGLRLALLRGALWFLAMDGSSSTGFGVEHIFGGRVVLMYDVPGISLIAYSTI